MPARRDRRPKPKTATGGGCRGGYSRRRAYWDGTAGHSAPAADAAGQHQEAGRLRDPRSILQQHQGDMADGQLHTLKREQKLKTSDAFRSYATLGRAGTDPECVEPARDGKGPLPGR
ncbi:hypothetical protein [Arthrobacter sp. H14-L1]|uniref:hypothetical protein n=1 Tax=Arthrobacter sp. H14-L1 TaxID=2996697 RepID=UPI00226F5065|nr:hypothetical protein [Arthrobacter sp. H14-L1]MCY0905070.1 hypothetical protein [Arthrobacter sp. H14-L1]